MSEKARYLGFGLVVGASLIFLLGMAQSSFVNKQNSEQVGTYQLAAGNGFYVVLDTRTGKITETKENPTRLSKFLTSLDSGDRLQVDVGGELVILK
jgi:hypothetical protein